MDIGPVDMDDSEVLINDSLVLQGTEGGLLGNTDTDIGKKNDVSLGVNLSSNEGIGTDLKKFKQRRKKKKNKSSSTTYVPYHSLDATPANSPYMPEIVEMGSERNINNETSLINNLVSSVEKQNRVLTGSDTKEANILPEMNATSDKSSSSYVHKKTRHRGKKKVFGYSRDNLEHDRNGSSVVASSLSEELQLVARNNDNASIRKDLNTTSTNSSFMTEIVGMGSVTKSKRTNEISLSGNLVSSVEKENSGLTGSDSKKTEMLSDRNANSDIVKHSTSHSRKRSQHKGKKNVYDYSQYNLEPDRNDSSIINSSVEMEPVGKKNLNASGKSDLVLKVGSGDSGLTKIADGNSPHESNSSPEMVRESLQVENPGSIETKMANQETEKTSNCFAWPSPIRGVVDDLDSTDLLNKKRDLLDSVTTEEVSLSFQTTLKVSMDNSSLGHSERVGSEDGSSTVHTENALDSMFTCIYSEKVDDLHKKNSSSSVNHIGKFALTSDVSKSEEELEAVPVLPQRTLKSYTRKKLLVFDLNGLLVDIIKIFCSVHISHKKFGRKSVIRRPFCEDFLKFCFERFDIGIWSSRRKCDVEDVIDYLMGEAKQKLLFCWDQSRCTVTGFGTLENVHKPLVLKELKKLWNKEESDLQWEKGDYSPSNTLLVDDSPYKALCNPPHTAIFPRPYDFKDANDNSLGPGGDLRVYLEGLAMADDVQKYVQEHPFGQRAITSTNPSWKFYLRVIHKIENPSASTRWR